MSTTTMAALWALILLPVVWAAEAVNSTAPTVDAPLFQQLDRTARLVDISYCVGGLGITEPFECASRCDEFPDVSLVTTWDTGPLLSDSCGYIALDHGGIGGSDGTILVSFRGTASLANFVVDLGTLGHTYTPYDPSGDGELGGPGKCRHCSVHSGFMRSWETARDWVVPELQRLRTQHPDYPIHLAGHSLGGAVACLAGLELKVTMGWDNIVVTTYGEPRVGNRQLAAYVNDVFGLGGADDDEVARTEGLPYRRVTHARDPVPMLPPDELGYRQHAGEIYISKEHLTPDLEDVHTCRGDTDERCSAGQPGIARLFLWRLFTGHRDYFSRMGVCMPGSGDELLPSMPDVRLPQGPQEDEL